MLDLGRSVTIRLCELRLDQARASAHRARLEFLRADLLDGDCVTAARHVREAVTRAADLEADLRALRAEDPRPH
jgi:hypothetical protein